MPVTTGTVSDNATTITHTFLQSDTICLIQTSGTFSSITYALTGSLDGTNYSPVAVIDMSIYANSTTGTFSTQSAGKILAFNCSMFKNLKLTSSAYSSGTMNVYVTSASGLPLMNIAGD